VVVGEPQRAFYGNQPGSQLRPGLAPWAKAGIILEPDTNQATAYAAVMVTGSHGVQMQYDYTHDSPGIAGAAGPSSPRWLRLTRAGDVITGYDSTDGSRWTEIGTARLARLPRTVQIGLFVTSPAYFPAGAGAPTSSVATATFDQVSARGDLPRRSWTGDPIAGFYPTVPSASTWQQRSAGAFTISGSGDIAPLVGDIISAQWAGASIVNGTILALLFVIVIAALFATSEYRRGLIRTTLTASPGRGRVLAAKAAVAGSLAFAAGAIATAIAEVITRHVLAANGSYLFPQSGPDLARVIIGTGLLLWLSARTPGTKVLLLHRPQSPFKGGPTPVAVAVDGRLRPAAGIAHALRPDSPAGVPGLRALGLQPVLATGDTLEAATATAHAAGITSVHAGLLPAGKSALVQQLRRERGSVGGCTVSAKASGGRGTPPRHGMVTPRRRRPPGYQPADEPGHRRIDPARAGRPNRRKSRCRMRPRDGSCVLTINAAACASQQAGGNCFCSSARSPQRPGALGAAIAEVPAS
jgi:hypothetical protein